LVSTSKPFRRLSKQENMSGEEMTKRIHHLDAMRGLAALLVSFKA
jgi:peptidoglycan/LPS O-acetylase OafA/YrhL